MSKQEFPKIAITGDLGSGKSAVSRILEMKLDFRIVSTGSIQRGIAEKYGMSTLELNEYTNTHTEIDDEIDGKISEMQHLPESLIFDSRLAWHFAPASFKVFLLVDPNVGAERIFNDKRRSENYQSLAETIQKLEERKKSEVERFYSYYGINYSDLVNYDLVIETTSVTPSEVAEYIIHSFEQWKNDKVYDHHLLSPFTLYPTRMVSCLKDHPDVQISVQRAGNVSLIIKGHDLVCRSIARKKNLVPVYMEFGCSMMAEVDMKKSFLEQWELFNNFKFREYPRIYK